MSTQRKLPRLMRYSEKSNLILEKGHHLAIVWFSFKELVNEPKVMRVVCDGDLLPQELFLDIILHILHMWQARDTWISVFPLADVTHECVSSRVIRWGGGRGAERWKAFYWLSAKTMCWQNRLRGLICLSPAIVSVGKRILFVDPSLIPGLAKRGEIAVYDDCAPF